MSKDSLKVCLIGESGVGKTAISNCIVGEKFVENGPPTIGSSYHFHSIKVGDETINLKIVDTAGQERFRSITKQHFRDAVGALLVFDITDRTSYDALDEWLNNFHQYSCPNAVCLLIGNKKDLADKRLIQSSEAEEFALRYNLTYVETSAKDSDSVTTAVLKLADEINRNIKNGVIVIQNAVHSELDPKQEDLTRKCC